MEIRDDIARENYKEYYMPAKRHRMPWFKDANRNDNFRYNQHFTETETRDMLRFRQAPLPIGLTAAICDMAEALFTSSDPIPRTVPIPISDDDPRKEHAKQVAYRYDAALKQTWRDSFGSLQFDKIITDYDNVGHGFHYVVPRNEFGQFFVDYKHIPWHYVYIDNATKDPLYRDADYQCISFILSKKQGFKLAKQVEPNLKWDDFVNDWAKKEFIDSPMGEYQNKYLSNTYKVDDSVRFIVRMQLEEQTVYQIIPKESGVNVPFRVVRELDEVTKTLQSKGLISVVEQRESYLTEYTSIGAKGWKKVFPIKNYNLIPAVYDHRGNPFPFGRVWYLYPLQRALNKFISLSILNASLSNSLKYFAEENSIVNESQLENFGSIPGVFIKWRRTTPDSQPPVAIQPVPLSDAFLAFPKFIIYMMEYVSGISSIMQGSAEGAPNVFSTVATLQSAGGLKIKRRLNNLQISLSQMGHVVAELYREYAPPDGQITSVNKDSVDTIGYNTTKVQDGKLTISPETDLSMGFKDIEFVMDSSKGYQAATESAMLTNLATQLKLPQLVPLILDRLNIRDADKVVEEIKGAQDMAAKIQDQEQSIQKLTQENGKLQNQVFGQIQQLVNENAKGKAGKVLERFRQDMKNAGINVDEFQKQLDQSFSTQQ